VEADVAALYLVDGDMQHKHSLGGDGLCPSIIPPGGFLVVASMRSGPQRLDASNTDSALLAALASADNTCRFDFSISGGDGETIRLLSAASGLEAAAASLDMLSVDDVPVGMSWGRLDDGGGDDVVREAAARLQPTPGAPNRVYPTAVALIENVSVNEVRGDEIYRSLKEFAVASHSPRVPCCLSEHDNEQT